MLARVTGLDLLLAEQSGAVSRRQLLQQGMSAARVRWLVDSGRFATLHPGVYAGFTGPVPARLRLVEAVLDTSRTLTEQDAAALVIQVVQRRLTSADRLAQAMVVRGRHRWRGLLLELLEQVRDGIESPLERRYLLRVERPHGLPRGTRNATGLGRRRDVRYQPFGVVIELDGAASHRPESRHRDFARDRSAVLNGDRVLVYGWTDVVASPCRTAAEVGALLNRNGWAGRAHPCGPTCPLATS